MNLQSSRLQVTNRTRSLKGGAQFYHENLLQKLLGVLVLSQEKLSKLLDDNSYHIIHLSTFLTLFHNPKKIVLPIFFFLCFFDNHNMLHKLYQVMCSIPIFYVFNNYFTIFENRQNIVVVVLIVVVESPIVESHAVIRTILSGRPPIATSDVIILFLTRSTSRDG